MMTSKYIELARILIQEVERNLQQVQPGQYIYYKQILMYTLYALGYAIDALVESKLRKRPIGHGDRIHYLAEIGRTDLRDLYQNLIVMVFSKLETVMELRLEDLTNIVHKVREVIDKISEEVSQTQHV